MEHSYSHTSEDVTSTLQALCQQEETHYRIEANYLMMMMPLSDDRFNKKVAHRRAKCRAAMVTWCVTVVDYLEFERDTVATALSYLDRFLETPNGQDCLSSPRQFKIAGMTCLYTAIKAHEPEAIEPELVVELSGNICSVDDIEGMERILLKSIHWRVNPPTALAFCRHLLKCVPTCLIPRDDVASLLDLAQVQTELAVAEPRLITTPPSLLALASIFNALESKQQSTMETLDDLSQLFFVALSSSHNLNNMDDVFDVQDVLDDIIRAHNDDTAEDDNEEEVEDASAAASRDVSQPETVLEEETPESDEEEEPTSPRTSASKPVDTTTTTAGRNDKFAPISVSPSALRYKAAEAA